MNKPVRLKTELWHDLDLVRAELAKQLNMNVSLPDTIGHLIKLYHEHTASMAAKPVHSGTEESSHA